MCIPKSVKESRIKENGEVFDFNISPEDMATMVRKLVTEQPRVKLVIL